MCQDTYLDEWSKKQHTAKEIKANKKITKCHFVLIGENKTFYECIHAYTTYYLNIQYKIRKNKMFRIHILIKKKIKKNNTNFLIQTNNKY